MTAFLDFDQGAKANAEAQPSRRSHGGAALVVALVLLLASVATWYSVAEARLDSVEFSAVAGGVTCSPGSVVLRDGAPAHVIAAAPGIRCTVVMEIRNTGDADVHVEAVTVSHGGPTSETPIRLVASQSDATLRTGLDAVMDLDEMLAAGRTRAVVLRFEFRADGCHGPNTAEYVVPQAPSVRITALRRTAEKRPSAPVYGAAPSRIGSCGV